MTRMRDAYEAPQLSFGVELLQPKRVILPAKRKTVLLKRWTWGRWVVTACPSCGCTPDKPCRIILDEECGEAACVPSGAYGSIGCSACAEVS